MSIQEWSVLAVTIGFGVVFWWAYRPANRKNMEAHGRIPLDEEQDHE